MRMCCRGMLPPREGRENGVGGHDAGVHVAENCIHQRRISELVCSPFGPCGCDFFLFFSMAIFFKPRGTLFFF